MEMFSDCSGPCEECQVYYLGGCLAGHGDDDFTQITIDDAKRILELKHTEDFRKKMLLKKFPQLSPKQSFKSIVLIWFRSLAGWFNFTQ
jgi:hypothetical protein